MANDATREVLDLERRGIEDFEAYRPLVSGEASWTAIRTGDPSRGVIDMGQSACFAGAVEPAVDIIASMVEDVAAAQAALTGKCR